MSSAGKRKPTKLETFIGKVGININCRDEKLIAQKGFYAKVFG